MRIRGVEYFLALMEQQSFTRAARVCGIAQPSLTAAIRRLEHELGGLLFHRGAHASKPTELAVLLHKDLAALLRAADRVRTKAYRFRARSIGANGENNADRQLSRSRSSSGRRHRADQPKRTHVGISAGSDAGCKRSSVVE